MMAAPRSKSITFPANYSKQLNLDVYLDCGMICVRISIRKNFEIRRYNTSKAELTCLPHLKDQVIIVCAWLKKAMNMVKPMENWRVELTARGKSLTEVKIQKGISQGDALSPLLFVIAMKPRNNNT